MMSKFVSFDDVRGILKDALREIDLPEGAPTVYVVRDLFGRIGLSVSEESKGDEQLRSVLDRLTQTLHGRLGAHGRALKQFVLWVHPELAASLEATVQDVSPGVKLADRLMVGGSWWTVGPEESKAPVRYTLHSVKGGVGLSTTAAVLAWHLASLGEDVLAVDLDLESSGLAATLLEPKARPKFGVADWFVEELVGQGTLIMNEIAGSPVWTRDLPGTVWIAPAHGRDPGEYLAKLGRVYMDTASDPWTARLQRLLSLLEGYLKPTVVILDSRSGLHDIAAAAVTDVGADVMLFGDDSAATWGGYKILCEHWRRLGLAPRVRERLSVVSALTPEIETEKYLARFREQSWDLFRETLYDTFAGNATSADSVSYAFADEDAPHVPLVINWNRGFAAGTSLRRLEVSALEQAYLPFLQEFERRHRSRSKEAVPVAVLR